MTKERWFDWSVYQRGQKKTGVGSYGGTVKKSAANIASGSKVTGEGDRFSAQQVKLAEALAQKYDKSGKLKQRVKKNASGAEMLNLTSR